MNELTILQIAVYCIFMFSITAYAALDGFDLGVGCLHLFTKTDDERRIFINAIGPVWDGNSVWIVITGGLLFAAFPRVFGTILPGLYLPITLLLAGYMFRACAIEFRSKFRSKRWRKSWDIAFALSSIVLTLGLGLVIGNFIYGFPIDKNGLFVFSEFSIFHPYAFMTTFFITSLFMLHGCMYLIMKTEGDLQKKLRKWVIYILVVFLCFWVLATLATFVFENRMLYRFRIDPWFIVFIPISFASIISLPFWVKKQLYGWGFIASMTSIISLMCLFAIGLFPNLLTSTINPSYSLNIHNSSSSVTTMRMVVIIAASGATLAGFYVTYIYKIFRGKVTIDPTSY